MKRVAVVVGVVLVVLLGVAQLVLPGIAERRVRDELEAVGGVSDVEISSFPAVKLLVGEVDSIAARLEDSNSNGQQVADLIAKAGGVDRLRISADRIRISGLQLTSARLAKDGDQLRVGASLSERDLIAFLPPGTELQSIASQGGELLLEGSFSVLGFQLSGPARVSPENGAIVLTPEGVPLAGLARVTVFSDDRVSVVRISAREAGSRLRLEAEGSVKN